MSEDGPSVPGGLSGVDVVVLAGGLGTRIRSVLGDTPKVLAPVAGRAFLGHTLDWLAGAGARRVVLCLGHRAERVQAWLAAEARTDLEIVTVVEPAPLGTAGALRLARPTLRSDPVLVMNGDTFVDADLPGFLEHHRASGAEASLLCVEVPDAERFGRVEIGSDGSIRRFAEKTPGDRSPGLINAGLYLFGAGWLDGLAAGSAVSLERDALTAASPGTLKGMACRAAFIDIGTPQSLDEAASVLPPRRHAGEDA